MPPAANIFTETFRVRSYEADPDGLASVQTLCNYLQDVAGSHAQALGVSMDRLAGDGLTWVLGRLHVQVDRYPRWGDAVRVETWPSGLRGLSATREFLFYDEAGAELGRGTSVWLIVDVARRRPVRLPDFIEAIEVPDRARPFSEPAPKLSAPTEAAHEASFRVRYSDLDVNRHVNNVRYAEWAVETVPLDVLRAARVAELTLNFRAETTYGDVVRAQAQPMPNDGGVAAAFRHRLLRAGDGREVALARTRWAAR